MRRQRGIVLLVSLMLLIMVMLLGVSAAQLALQSEKAARGERDRDVAFLAAEDALKDAERDVLASGAAFAPDCATARHERAAPGKAPVWQAVDLAGAACTLPYGARTAASMPTGEGFLPFKKPQYIVERMECHRAGDDASAGAAPSYCYRVTAIGFGARPETEVVLQSVFSKPEGAP
ncbi:type IV pilus assembly protein PilX [Duganella sp. SG902]|uniref:pilus assembly PilX family protein n=1 Tax=Duganella sp. SG902 TaxID=2587016 RepID=UPI00159D5545|nr:PilX N-terminal domain-containing pilus assembly protein [Duganella sp. SG902]NVM78932.1 type IV pilus assembly protein PilX [Duganella sp. SG902]